MNSIEDSVMHFRTYLLDLNLHSQQLLVLKMPLVELPLLIVQAIKKRYDMGTKTPLIFNHTTTQLKLT